MHATSIFRSLIPLTFDDLFLYKALVLLEGHILRLVNLFQSDSHCKVRHFDAIPKVKFSLTLEKGHLLLFHSNQASIDNSRCIAEVHGTQGVFQVIHFLQDRLIRCQNSKAEANFLLQLRRLPARAFLHGGLDHRSILQQIAPGFPGNQLNLIEKSSTFRNRKFRTFHGLHWALHGSKVTSHGELSQLAPSHGRNAQLQTFGNLPLAQGEAEGFATARGVEFTKLRWVGDGMLGHIMDGDFISHFWL
mmetsp:Transcript_64367/g.141109  ORF Transcript_64367/g.141109 Transcript_64367/m.141109 type:complete len:247 (-) Transcript_64367:173-913(-)